MSDKEILGERDWMRPVDTWAEHCSHEENSRYDQFDGYDGRDYCGEQADNMPCFDCTDEADCPSCAKAKAWLEENDRLDREEAAARAVREDDPDSSYFVPF